MSVGNKGYGNGNVAEHTLVALLAKTVQLILEEVSGPLVKDSEK